MNRPRLAVGAVVLATCLMAIFLPAGYVTNLIYVGLASIVTMGLVLLIGVGGMTSFGQAAFVGTGAYASAYVTTRYGLPAPAGLLASVAATGIAASLLGLLTMRLKAWYLPLGTLACGLAIYYYFGTAEMLRGHTGFGNIPPLSVGPLSLIDERSSAIAVWIVSGLCTVLMINLLDSRTGRAMRTLRGRVVMGEAFGLNTAWLRFRLFVLSALLASVSGWLYVHIVRFVNPSPFSLTASMDYLFMAVVGGAGSIWGAFLGALILVTSRQWLVETLPQLIGTQASYEMVVFGLTLILLLQRTRNGLVPFVQRCFPKTRTAEVPDTAAPPLARLDTGPAPVLSVRGVSKSFGGLKAVSDLDFEVRTGEVVGLIGPNGAGKSTLFNVVTGVLPADGGEILFAGRRLERLPSRAMVRLGLARTFQHVQLRSDLSCGDNVAIGAHIRTRSGMLRSMLRLDRAEENSVSAEAQRQLARVGLSEEYHVPAGELSLGQQRLVEIARALAADPRILMLDEPAAGLRHQEKQALAALLNSLRGEGRGILIVEHDMEFLMSIADRVVVMVSGAKLTEGAPAGVQRDPRVIEAYLGAEPEAQLVS
ncbi:MAG: ATP-binding cassette domain-containing protein [Flavobacteriaceae bacterium]